MTSSMLDIFSIIDWSMTELLEFELDGSISFNDTLRIGINVGGGNSSCSIDEDMVFHVLGC